MILTGIRQILEITLPNNVDHTPLLTSYQRLCVTLSEAPLASPLTVADPLSSAPLWSSPSSAEHVTGPSSRAAAQTTFRLLLIAVGHSVQNHRPRFNSYIKDGRYCQIYGEEAIRTIVSIPRAVQSGPVSPVAMVSTAHPIPAKTVSF